MKNKNRNKKPEDKARLHEILTKEFLYEKFWVEKLTYSQISEMVGCCNATLSIFVKKFGLNRKIHKRPDIFPGAKFYKLTVIAKTNRIQNKNVVWECLCDCGKTSFVMGGNLKSGGSKSCGCSQFLKGKDSKSWKGFEELPGRYWIICKHNAKNRGLEFNLDIEYGWNLFVKQDKKCALTGWPIAFHEPGTNPATQTASLDRINSNEGYEVGNVQWVHKDINFIKSDTDEEYFIDMCAAVAKTRRSS